MNTVKNGSKGADVKSLQEALNKLGYGLTADGIFGPKTEAAVKDYQKKNGLDADGIVGPKTWAKLGYNVPSNAPSSKVIDPSVVFLPLSVCLSKLSTPRVPKYLVIHYTAGSSSQKGSARGCRDVFIASSKTKNPASADFAVDDAEMVQFNPDIENYNCWAVGGSRWAGKGASLYGVAKNANCVSIELCSNLAKGADRNAANHHGWSFSEATIDNAVKLAKIIMKKYNIPPERVIRHYDVTGKYCPGVPGWNDEPLYDTSGKYTGQRNGSDKWIEFKKRIAQ